MTASMAVFIDPTKDVERATLPLSVVRGILREKCVQLYLLDTVIPLSLAEAEQLLQVRDIQ